MSVKRFNVIRVPAKLSLSLSQTQDSLQLLYRDILQSLDSGTFGQAFWTEFVTRTYSLSSMLRELHYDSANFLQELCPLVAAAYQCDYSPDLDAVRAVLEQYTDDGLVRASPPRHSKSVVQGASASPSYGGTLVEQDMSIAKERKAIRERPETLSFPETKGKARDVGEGMGPNHRSKDEGGNQWTGIQIPGTNTASSLNRGVHQGAAWLGVQDMDKVMTAKGANDEEDYGSDLEVIYVGPADKRTKETRVKEVGGDGWTVKGEYVTSSSSSADGLAKVGQRKGAEGGSRESGRVVQREENERPRARPETETDSFENMCKRCVRLNRPCIKAQGVHGGRKACEACRVSKQGCSLALSTHDGTPWWVAILLDDIGAQRLLNGHLASQIEAMKVAIDALTMAMATTQELRGQGSSPVIYQTLHEKMNPGAAPTTVQIPSLSPMPSQAISQTSSYVTPTLTIRPPTPSMHISPIQTTRSPSPLGAAPPLKINTHTSGVMSLGSMKPSVDGQGFVRGSSEKAPMQGSSSLVGVLNFGAGEAVQHLDGLVMARQEAGGEKVDVPASHTRSAAKRKGGDSPNPPNKKKRD